MDNYTGKRCGGYSGYKNVYTSRSYPVQPPKLICSNAPNANGKKIVPLTSRASTPAASRKKQEIVKVCGCSKLKSVYSCSNPTRVKTKVYTALVKKDAKGSKVCVVVTYTSTSKVVVSVEKEETVEVIAGFHWF